MGRRNDEGSISLVLVFGVLALAIVSIFIGSAQDAQRSTNASRDVSITGQLLSYAEREALSTINLCGITNPVPAPVPAGCPTNPLVGDNYLAGEDHSQGVYKWDVALNPSTDCDGKATAPYLNGRRTAIVKAYAGVFTDLSQLTDAQRTGPGFAALNRPVPLNGATGTNPYLLDREQPYRCSMAYQAETTSSTVSGSQVYTMKPATAMSHVLFGADGVTYAGGVQPSDVVGTIGVSKSTARVSTTNAGSGIFLYNSAGQGAARCDDTRTPTQQAGTNLCDRARRLDTLLATDTTLMGKPANCGDRTDGIRRLSGSVDSYSAYNSEATWPRSTVSGESASDITNVDVSNRQEILNAVGVAVVVSATPQGTQPSRASSTPQPGSTTGCYGSLTLNRSVNSGPSDVYVTNLTVASGGSINTNTRFWVSGTVTFSNPNGAINASIYAPNSACNIPSVGVGFSFTGSLVCKSINIASGSFSRGTSTLTGGGTANYLWQYDKDSTVNIGGAA